jgi:hypothetical protein
MTSSDNLALARRHLAKVHSALEPPDVADWTIYGMYVVEAAIPNDQVGSVDEGAFAESDGGSYCRGGLICA